MGFGPTIFSLARRRSTTEPRPQGFTGAETQDRTEDTAIFSRVLYQLSYLGAHLLAHTLRRARRGLTQRLGILADAHTLCQGIFLTASCSTALSALQWRLSQVPHAQ